MLFSILTQSTFALLPFFVWSSPVHPRESLSTSLNLVVEAIPLRRSGLDLQHSSRALRASYTNLNLDAARLNTSLPQSGSAILRATAVSFLAEVKFGLQTFLAVVDTGSADTWIAESNFQCVDLGTRRPAPQQRCNFGPTYKTDNHFKQIQNENFNITYGDGEFLAGIVGNVSVTLANVRVPSQQVSLSTLAAWEGDGKASGLIGLAYPALTANYAGSDPYLDRYCSPGLAAKNCNQVTYSSLIDNMFFQSKVAKPMFALALSRDESNSGNGGYLTIGGIPQLNRVGIKNNSFASTPIRILRGDNKFRYYLINIEDIVLQPPPPQTSPSKRGVNSPILPQHHHHGHGHGHFNLKSDPHRHPHEIKQRTTRTTKTRTKTTISSSSATTTATATTTKTSTRTPSPITTTSSSSSSGRTILPNPPNQSYIIDSGTALSFLPSSLVKTISSSFSPPATFDPSTGFYLVSCTAQPPTLGITIGGQTFYHNGKDLITRFDAASTTCISGIQDGSRLSSSAGGNEGSGVNILGDVFLNNVLAVFDLEAGLIRFAARMDYKS